MLTGLLLIPILGCLALLPINGDTAAGVERIKKVALTTSLITFVLSVIMWGEFDSSATQYQFVQEFNSLSFCHLNIGVDGISLYFVLLTTFMIPLLGFNTKGFGCSILSSGGKYASNIVKVITNSIYVISMFIRGVVIDMTHSLMFRVILTLSYVIVQTLMDNTFILGIIIVMSFGNLCYIGFAYNSSIIVNIIIFLIISTLVMVVLSLFAPTPSVDPVVTVNTAKAEEKKEEEEEGEPTEESNEENKQTFDKPLNLIEGLVTQMSDSVIYLMGLIVFLSLSHYSQPLTIDTISTVLPVVILVVSITVYLSFILIMFVFTVEITNDVLSAVTNTETVEENTDTGVEISNGATLTTSNVETCINGITETSTLVLNTTMTSIGHITKLSRSFINSVLGTKQSIRCYATKPLPKKLAKLMFEKDEGQETTNMHIMVTRYMVSGVPITADIINEVLEYKGTKHAITDDDIQRFLTAEWVEFDNLPLTRSDHKKFKDLLTSHGLKTSGIYHFIDKADSTINGVGSSANMLNRVRAHIYNNTHGAITKHIHKVGISNFKLRVLILGGVDTSLEYRLACEQFFIMHSKATLNVNMVTTGAVAGHHPQWAIDASRELLGTKVYVYHNGTLIHIFASKQQGSLQLGKGRVYLTKLLGQSNGVFRKELIFTETPVPSAPINLMTLPDFLVLFNGLANTGTKSDIAPRVQSPVLSVKLSDGSEVKHGTHTMLIEWLKTQGVSTNRKTLRLEYFDKDKIFNGFKFYTMTKEEYHASDAVAVSSYEDSK